MCVVWNEIIDTLNRVNIALQALGIEIGSVVMHCHSLLEKIRSLRQSESFDRFENKAKSTIPGLDYDEIKKRPKKGKQFHDETPDEAGVSNFRESFRVNTHLVIVDHLLSEIEKRKTAYTSVYERFGVLTEIQTLTDTDTTSKCAELFIILKKIYVFSQSTDPSRQVLR